MGFKIKVDCYTYDSKELKMYFYQSRREKSSKLKNQFWHFKICKAIQIFSLAILKKIINGPSQKKVQVGQKKQKLPLFKPMFLIKMIHFIVWE